MKKIKVGFWYCVYGTSIVEAETIYQAEKKLKLRLEEQGLEGLKFEGTDLDVGTQDGMEVK